MTTAQPPHAGSFARVGKRSLQALAAIALTIGASAVMAAERTLSVVESVQLASAPAKTWDTIKNFSTWQAWHPAFASTDVVQGDGHSRGTVRVLTTKDGGKFTEELVAYDAASRSYQYRIVESPAPVVGYVSTIEVKATKTGSSVVWSSTFQVKPGTSDEDAKNLISGVYRAGLDHLAAVIK